MKFHKHKEEEITDALISLGMKRIAARTLAVLQNVDEITSVKIQYATRLRQPEVKLKILKEKWNE